MLGTALKWKQNAYGPQHSPEKQFLSEHKLKLLYPMKLCAKFSWNILEEKSFKEFQNIFTMFVLFSLV